MKNTNVFGLLFNRELTGKPFFSDKIEIRHKFLDRNLVLMPNNTVPDDDDLFDYREKYIFSCDPATLIYVTEKNEKQVLKIDNIETFKNLAEKIKTLDVFQKRPEWNIGLLPDILSNTHQPLLNELWNIVRINKEHAFSFVELQIIRLRQEVIDSEDPIKSFKAMMAAASLGCPHSAIFLHSLYTTVSPRLYAVKHELDASAFNKVVNKNWEDADFYAKLALKNGSKTPMFDMGIRHLNGCLVDKSTKLLKQPDISAAIQCFLNTSLAKVSLCDNLNISPYALLSLESIFMGKKLSMPFDIKIPKEAKGSLDSVLALIEIARFAAEQEAKTQAMLILKRLSQTDINPEATLVINSFLNNKEKEENLATHLKQCRM
jgi:hypothetical protein